MLLRSHRVPSRENQTAFARVLVSLLLTIFFHCQFPESSPVTLILHIKTFKKIHLSFILTICSWLAVIQNTYRVTPHTFVSSRLDYCNNLLHGFPQVQIDKIQRVQNAAARLIFQQPKFCHITPVLSQLHWLPIKYRIEFNILLMTFKAIHGMAPDYICKLISRRKSTGYSLRSSKKVMLEVPSGKILPTLGGRAFCYAAPKLWNNLPSEISSLDTLSNFKCHVKTYLFN